MKPWRHVKSETLVADRWLKLRADECQLPSGKTLAPYYVLEDRDWVQIFARTPDGRVLTVTQFRYAGNAVCVELPGGIVDENEPPLAAAQRELREETGFEASTWTEVATMFANPARQTNRIHVFLAEGLSAGGAQALDEAEDIAFGFFDVPALKASILDGSFSQALHIAGVYLALEFLQRREAGE